MLNDKREYSRWLESKLAAVGEDEAGAKEEYVLLSRPLSSIRALRLADARGLGTKFGLGNCVLYDFGNLVQIFRIPKFLPKFAVCKTACLINPYLCIKQTKRTE